MVASSEGLDFAVRSAIPERTESATPDHIPAAAKGALRPQTLYLRSAAAALVLFASVIIAGHLYVESLLRNGVHALAPQMFDQKALGAALQREALRQPDLLPVYGSSELWFPNPYHASAVFKNYPTGFTVFPIGRSGVSSSLIWLQAVAAVAEGVRGKKVVFSVYPGSFTKVIDPFSYAGNYSRLQAGELAFSPYLSFATKQAAARRMLQYPGTVANDPFLGFALEALADGSWGQRALYYSLVPLGKLRNIVLRLQDEWEMLIFIHKQTGLQAPVREAHPLDWPGLMSRAEHEAERRGRGHPFGFWSTHSDDTQQGKAVFGGGAAGDALPRSAEWTDLEILLRALRELDARLLILSPPLNGAFYDSLGIPYRLRQSYYRGLNELARQYGARVVDFPDHDADQYFTMDLWFHLSHKGWVYYDQALDEFFHSDKVKREG